jgi:FAD/FMN-containing dehydrogenase
VGTSLEGNSIPVRNGISIDFQEMSKVLAIRQENFQVAVQAGVIYEELNKTLGRHGLLFPPDPGATATIGGMIGKCSFLKKEHGEILALMQRIKALLDPKGLMNPGKFFV